MKPNPQRDGDENNDKGKGNNDPNRNNKRKNPSDGGGGDDNGDKRKKENDDNRGVRVNSISQYLQTPSFQVNDENRKIKNKNGFRLKVFNNE